MLNHASVSRVVGRSENPAVPVSYGGHNLARLVEIGLTNLPKAAHAMAPQAPPGTTPLVSSLLNAYYNIRPKISHCVFSSHCALWHKSQNPLQDKNVNQILFGPGLPIPTYFVFRPIKVSNLTSMLIEIKEIHYQDNSKRVLYSLVLDQRLELLEQHIGHFFEDYYSECNRTFQDQNAPYNKFIRCFHQFFPQIFLSWKRKHSLLV